MGKVFGKRRPGRPFERDVRKAARLVVQGVPVTNAMQEIGYSKTTANSNQKILTEHPQFISAKKKYQAEFERQDDRIVEKVVTRMREGLDAVDLKMVRNMSGKVVDTEQHISWDQRRKTAMDIAKVFGVLDDDQDGPDGSTYNLNMFIQIVQQAEKERGLA